MKTKDISDSGIGAEATVTNPEALREARDKFITQWGSLGSAWGINRTMAQIHALLLVAEGPMSTDEVMDALGISRGNANQNLRELVEWGLVRGVYQRGKRKEFFEAEKDVWKIFCLVARERKRRETEPALQVLRECAEITSGETSPEGVAFRKQIDALAEFVSLANGTMDRIATSSESEVIPMMLRIFRDRGK